MSRIYLRDHLRPLKMILLPISMAVFAVSLYLGLQQEVQWLRPTRDYFGTIMNNWTYPQISATNTTNDWNILYHLGGNGPWIPKVDGVVEGGLAPPEGCRVEQVHMVARHNERYPTSRTAAKMVSLHNRLRTLDFNLQGDLSFFHNWTFFMPQNYTSKSANSFPQARTPGLWAPLRRAYPSVPNTQIFKLHHSHATRPISGRQILTV